MGIVHRDVKPGNLMVDAAGKLWVADFGLARFGPDAGLTMTGDLLGTLRYMAPEQALAKHGLADHRVDVYGLGCTLYELVTGKPAAGGEDKAGILRHLAFEEPVAPRKLDKTIPAELETIALKCLAKEPSDRYGTAGELAADLRRFLDDKPIIAKPPGLRGRLGKLARRHRGALSVGTAVLALAVVGLAAFTAVVLKQRNEISSQRDQIETALGQAQTNLAIADRQRQQARQAVDDMYTQVAEKWLKGEPGMTNLQREFLDKALRFYEDLSREEGDRPQLVFERAQAGGRLGEIFRMLERRTEAEAAHRRSIADLESLDIQGKTVELAKEYDALGVLLSRIPGRREDAVSAIRRALILCESLPADEAAKPEVRDRRAHALTDLSGALVLCGRQAECEPVFRQGVDLLRGLTAEFPENHSYHYMLGGTLNNYAIAVCTLGDRARGQELLEEAIRHQEEAVRLAPRVADYRLFLRSHYSSLATHALAPLKRFPEAVVAARKSLAITEQLAADFPMVPHYQRCLADSYGILGEALATSGQLTEADDAFRHAVTIQDRLLAADPTSGIDRVMAGAQRTRLAGARVMAHRNAEAVADYQKAFELEPPDSEHRYNAACAAALAGCGQGVGADKLDPGQRAILRQQALGWLSAELIAGAKCAETAADRPKIGEVLQHWLEDADLAGVRDPAALAKLPEAERDAWRKLWADVAALLKRNAETPAAKLTAANEKSGDKP